MRINKNIVVMLFIIINMQSCKISNIYTTKTNRGYPLGYMSYYYDTNKMKINFSYKFHKEVDTIFNMDFRLVANNNDTLIPYYFSYHNQKDLTSISYTTNYIDFRNEVFMKKNSDLKREDRMQYNNRIDDFIYYFTVSSLGISFYNPKIKIKGRKTKHLYFLLSIKYKNKKGKIINLKKKYILDRKRVLAPLINTH